MSDTRMRPRRHGPGDCSCGRGVTAEYHYPECSYVQGGEFDHGYKIIPTTERELAGRAAEHQNLIALKAAAAKLLAAFPAGGTKEHAEWMTARDELRALLEKLP